MASEEDCLSPKKSHPFHFDNVGNCHFVDSVKSVRTRVASGVVVPQPGKSTNNFKKPMKTF